MATSTRFKLGQPDYIEQLNEMDDTLNNSTLGGVFFSANFALKDSTDNTKIGKFDVSNVTPASTVTWKFPNYSGTVALLDNTPQTFAGLLTFSNDVTVGGGLFTSVQTGITASGTDQASATAITKDLNIISTAASGSGVRLPVASDGRTIVIVNSAANSVNVYPATGAQIESLAANAAYSVAAGERKTLKASSATQWFVMTVGSGGDPSTSTISTFVAGTNNAASVSASDSVTGAIKKLADNAGSAAYSRVSGGPTDNIAGAHLHAMGGLMSSIIVPHTLSDLSTVASVTVPAPGTPANEVITTTASYGLGSAGSNDWGGHQLKDGRTADGTHFFIWFDSSYNLKVSKSAVGGAFGSAWSVIDTINMTARESKDKDAHLLCNGISDVVHVVCSDNSGNYSTYRILTYSSTGTKINDQRVPGRWPGGSAATSVGWFSQTQSPNYSAAAIGVDGVICLVSSLSTGTLDGSATSEMNAIKRWQLGRWSGGRWKFTPIYSQRLSNLTNQGVKFNDVRDNGGPRLNYDRIWVSPPGHEGYIVGICGMDVKFKDWSAVRNPNYSSSWTNTNADATYFGSGRYAELWMWKVPLSNPASMSIYSMYMPIYRTTDLPSSPPSAAYGGFIIQDVFLDSSGHAWVSLNEGDTNTTQQRNVVVFGTNGAQLAKFVSAGGATSGTMGGFFEDQAGAVWVQYVASGNGMSTKLLTTTVSGGVPTAIQTVSSATEQNTTAWARNLTTNMYQCIPTAAAFQFQPNKRNGSTLTHNWFDMIVGCGPDHTGTAPGTAQTLPTNGTYQFKRVRVQIPAA